jgi:ribosomal protein L3 glutamine methyltransferase
MDFVRALFAAAPARMTDDAVLVLEIGHEREFFEAAFPALEVVWLPTQLHDDAVLLVTRSMLEHGLAPAPNASSKT